MKKLSGRGILWDYGLITLGCALYAFAFQCFFETNLLPMGGFTGMVQVFKRFIPGLPIGITVFLMNVPLMVIGVRKEGWGLLFASVYATFVSSMMIDGLAITVSFPKTEPLLACLYGGVLLGAALGIMMRKAATTGGTELAARLLKYRFRGISIGRICLVIDVIVICTHALTFRSMEHALYGTIAMYVSSLAMDLVVYGSASAKLAVIISDRSEAIRERLMALGLGATILEGHGAWTGREKHVLMCAAKRSMLTAIKEAVASVDPDKSFVIVCDAREVMGEGFAACTAEI